MSSGLVPPSDLIIIVGLPAAVGTVMLFGQATAPVGWVAQSASNNAAIRVMGAGNFVGTGGASNLSALLQGGLSTDSHTISIGEMPSHNHNYSDPGHQHLVFDPANVGIGIQNGSVGVSVGNASPGSNPELTQGASINITISNNGGGGGHVHGLTNFNVKFQDVIMATKS